MSMQAQIAHFRFTIPDEVRTLSPVEARARIPAIFEELLKKLMMRHVLDNLEIVNRLPRMLSFDVAGPPEACERLATFLESTGLGKQTPDERISVSK